ncbi:hypothetical protein [Oceanobacillus polygoni]|uniref:Uncharacterized protein n=1 Tax=Oceanobacillus polygoni TaxID=1235259 RepID=A0A9X0YPN4_9BACI|nr:hypothetical protein [Oceanobacillus polygoni]MBP2076413.1 hypothetical protein [Oceanobacillus polygoni]
MILQRGITGKNHNVDDHFPKPAGKEFKQLCYTLIAQLDGRVLAFSEPQIDTNYFHVELEVFKERLHLLLNENHRYLAVASEVDYFKLTFIDEPTLTRQFAPYYTVLQQAELNERIQLRPGRKKGALLNENDLCKEELVDLVYWNPKTVGQAVFNHWD